MRSRPTGRVATTRRRLRALQLDETFDDLVAVLYLYAEVADDVSARPDSRIRAGQAWASAWQDVLARLAERDARTVAWGASRPRAV